LRPCYSDKRVGSEQRRGTVRLLFLPIIGLTHAKEHNWLRHDAQDHHPHPKLRRFRPPPIPSLASRVSAMLGQVQQFRQMTQAGAAGSGMILLHRENSGAAADPGNAGGTSPEPPPKAQTNFSATKFIRGTLSRVDCSPPPLATLTVVSGSETWKMNVADTNHLVLIGADKFSCDWKRQKVMLNYHETSGGEGGNVVFLEIQ
jgi:hypothetical protein